MSHILFVPFYWSLFLLAPIFNKTSKLQIYFYVAMDFNLALIKGRNVRWIQSEVKIELGPVSVDI